MPTVIQHVLSRLYELGIKDVLGVAGDYAFPIEDAICSDKKLRWIGCCNELNAAYAADGYARIHGMAALSTTFGVGELSAINGVAGAYAEYLPVFHLVGMPATDVQQARRLVHHTLGNGEFDLFYNMAAPTVCARAVMTPENCVAETERLITAAKRERRPVYMGFPSDYANTPVVDTMPLKTQALPKSDPVVLKAAVTAIVDKLSASKTACILPGILVSRRGLAAKATAVVDASNLPFATMFMDKCVIDESHPNYIGMYDGKLMDKHVGAFVEGCDCVLGIGAMMTDFNSGGFTAQIDKSKSINILQNSVRVASAVYSEICMEDVLTELAKSIPRKQVAAPKAKDLGEPTGEADGKITAGYMYPRWQRMLKPNDILITETGTSSMGLGFVHMPKGSTFQNQTLWGSIGWATPAAFGAALAAPKRRTILVTGEGSHQLTAQEVSQFYRFKLKPIIFVLNNDGYLIERLLCKDPEMYYNDLAQWNYAQLPAALGCQDWFTARVTTCGQLDEAIKKAESCGTGAYIEVVTGRYEASALAQKVHDYRASLYS
ncbi:pyruvate decarboxylase [Podila verticillata NRRL 6337]|nr:pyruvate decarboxylase [Podila verticillata NRRL 6337]